MLGQLQEENRPGQGQQAQGDVDPEHPAPAGAFGEPAAQQRAGHRGDGEDAAHHAHVFAAFTGRNDVGDDRLGEDHQAAAAQALDDAGDDEHAHVAGERAHHRTDHEQNDGCHQQGLASHEVTELAVDRHGDGGGEDERGDDPQHVVDAVEFAHDGGQRRAQHGLVQRRQEHGEHKAHEEQHDVLFLWRLPHLGAGRVSHESFLCKW